MKLGIIIPYYNNSEVCKKNFKLLMEVIKKQLSDDMILFIYEDGQYSEWLENYIGYKNIFIFGDKINRGVSYARNKGLEFFFHPEEHVDYILFLDSDDMIDKYYLILMYKAMLDSNADILESRLFIRDKLYKYDDHDIRDCVCGQCIRADLIKDIRFNENICIGEDTLFMKELWNRYKIKKKLVETNYYYNLGDNIKSLWMRYKRHEIDKDKILNSIN